MTFNANIDRWHAMITPPDHSKPWMLGSGGSWDMFDVQPIPDEMLAELAQRYHTGGAPWNCRSMPLSETDREWMFLLYYAMQGLVARMRQAEAALDQQAIAAAGNWTLASSPPDADTTVLLALSDGEVWQGYLDGADWTDVSGMRLESGRVTHWMHVPVHPEDSRE